MKEAVNCIGKAGEDKTWFVLENSSTNAIKSPIRSVTFVIPYPKSTIGGESESGAESGVLCKFAS
jgi:hypothetical protein